MYIEKGDCLTLMNKLPAQCVDLILCDLPYGITDAKWDKALPCDKLWKQYYRVLKPHGTVALFAAYPFTVDLISTNRKNFKYDWVWVKNTKTGFANAHFRPLRVTEEILIFAHPENRKGLYYPQGLVKIPEPKSRRRGAPGTVYRAFLNKVYTPEYTNYPCNILPFIVPAKKQHPTEKPVDLLEYLIKTYTEPGMTVLDNCMGSGSTGVAALNTGRDFIGFEKEQTFFTIAAQRILQAQDANKQEAA